MLKAVHRVLLERHTALSEEQTVRVKVSQPSRKDLFDASHISDLPRQTDLTESVYRVVLQQLIPAQICQLIYCISNSKGYVDGFEEELTSANRV